MIDSKRTPFFCFIEKRSSWYLFLCNGLLSRQPSSESWDLLEYLQR